MLPYMLPYQSYYGFASVSPYAYVKLSLRERLIRAWKKKSIKEFWVKEVRVPRFGFVSSFEV